MTHPAEVALVEVGCYVWVLDLDRTDADANAVKGGVVYAIETDVDTETGEVQRRFMCATQWRGAIRFDVVLADEVRTVDRAQANIIRNLIRAAAGVVAKSKRIFATDEARCIALQHELLKVLG